MCNEALQSLIYVTSVTMLVCCHVHCRHLGAVNTVTFVDKGRRFVTTSDDKSLRVWEW